MTHLALLLALNPALAGDTGTLTVERKGLGGYYLFVDGEAKGKFKKKAPPRIELPAGPHEVWLSLDDEGFITFCGGVVDVAAGGTTTITLDARNTCPGVKPGEAPAGTMAKGALIHVDGDGWAAVDGRDRRTIMAAGLLFNVTPGTHVVEVTEGVGRDQRTLCAGKVTVAKGATATVIAREDGTCVGLDEPPAEKK